MNALALTQTELVALPALVDRAAKALSGARTAAEVLEARDLAGVAYDVAKRTARIARAKQAHDDLLAAVYRAQADALVIEAQAKRRMADEYDAAQNCGEVQPHGGQGKRDVPKQNIPTAADVGLSRKEIHDARIVRDAEAVEPGVVQRAVDDAVAAGEEPTRALVNRAVKARRPVPKPRGHRNVVEETQHDRDLRMLLGVWESACETAQAAFLEVVNNGEADGQRHLNHGGSGSSQVRPEPDGHNHHHPADGGGVEAAAVPATAAH